MNLPETATSRILKIEDLTVAYRQGKNWLDAVRDVNLEIHAGQTYGLVGESGSGKTTIALAIMRYLGANGRIQTGKIILDGQDLCALTERDLPRVWGTKLRDGSPGSALFVEPLDPDWRTVGRGSPAPLGYESVGS